MGYVSTMFRRLPAFLVRLLMERRTFAVEVYLALQALFFGLWLLMPWDAFGQIGANAVVMLVPEGVWGALFVGHAILHLHALEVGSTKLRMRGTSMVVFLWLLVLWGFLAAYPLSSAVPMYLFPVLAGMWAHNAQTYRWSRPQ